MIEQRYYFYRPAIDGHLLDNAISAVEQLRANLCPLITFDFGRVGLNWRLRTSHAEFADHTNGIMFTSTMRGDENGTVMRPSETVLTHPDRWYYYWLNVHDDSHKAAVDVLIPLVENNQGYDKRYIVKFLTGPLGRKVIEWIIRNNLNDPNKFICSGITALAASTTIGEEWENHRARWSLVLELERLMRRFRNDEPDPLSLSLAFWYAGFTPYSAVDDKPLVRGQNE